MGQKALDAARILVRTRSDEKKAKKKNMKSNTYKVETTQIPITPEEFLALGEPRQRVLFASAPALPGKHSSNDNRGKYERRRLRQGNRTSLIQN